MLFLTSENRLTTTQKKLIHNLCKSSSALELALVLTREFRHLMENKLGNQLRDWIENVLHSGISEITTFANRLLREYQSIENAISLPWSNGPVEGNVNKLKTIKRQMYGRASFELLRKRLVLKPT
ncbi:ISL3 family transposase [Pedobacter frigoris]